MAGVALVGWLVFLAIGAGWRSWHQRRLTGDHGFRGLSAPFGSKEQLAGAAVAVGAAVSVAAPVLVLLGVIDCWRLLERSPATAALALVLYVAGTAITVRAQLDMGASWRIGVDPRERTALATRGLYRYARNPIYSGMLLVWVAEALLVPNAVSVAGVALTLVAIDLLVRGVEEPYLLGVHGESYRAYARAVGRFVPGLGRLA